MEALREDVAAFRSTVLSVDDNWSWFNPRRSALEKFCRDAYKCFIHSNEDVRPSGPADVQGHSLLWMDGLAGQGGRECLQPGVPYLFAYTLFCVRRFHVHFF